jgi:predicted alpha/beta-hydrolase family hydrolase
MAGPWSLGLGALARRGVDAIAIDLPRGRAENATGAFRDALGVYPGAAVGGHSFGGRVASLLAAQEPSVEALVLLSYPLHLPDRFESLRNAHWPSINCPVIALSGQSDPFASLALLEESAKLIPSVELVTYPGVGHSLLPVIDDAADRVSEFLRHPSISHPSPRD